MLLVGAGGAIVAIAAGSVLARTALHPIDRLAQTADAMGCAVGTVKSQVSAAMTKLRQRLGDDPDLLPALDAMGLNR